MTFDITRQQLFPSLLTLLACSVAGTLSLYKGGYLDVEMIQSEALLSSYINSFQLLHPLLAAIIASTLILFSAVWLGQIISAQNILNTNTTIHIPLLGVMLWVATLNPEYLRSALIILFVVRAMGSLLHSAHNTMTSAPLFNASLSISLLPLIYAPAVLLWAMLPIILIFMAITLREWLIAIVGVILPAAGVVYIFWFFGGEFIPTFELMIEQLTECSHILTQFEKIPAFRSSILGVGLILSLISTLWIGGTHSRTRLRLTIGVIMLLSALLSFTIPSASLLTSSLIAPPLAMLTALSLVHMRGWPASIIYFSLIILLLLAMITPQYLDPAIFELR